MQSSANVEVMIRDLLSIERSFLLDAMMIDLRRKYRLRDWRYESWAVAGDASKSSESNLLNYQNKSAYRLI